jgi:surface protein
MIREIRLPISGKSATIKMDPMNFWKAYNMMRLQKYLALCGVASRRKAEEMIAEGRVTVNGVKITEMGTQVEEGDEVRVDGQVIRPENSTSHWFYECRNLTDADLTRLDTASVTDMSFMFCHCEKLTALSQQFDTGKVTDMRSMFANARMLDILDLTGFHTAAVSSMNAMFYGGSRLQNIFVSDAWTTEAAADSAGMFYNCRNLPNFDASCTDRTRAHIGSDGYLSKEL